VVKKQPKQRPRNSALRSTVAFDNGLGAGECGRKTRTKKKEIVSVGSFFLSLRKRRYFCSLTSLSFLSLSFILKKK
jgi:hypothetical protein